jgi:hypothetical protein
MTGSVLLYALLALWLLPAIALVGVYCMDVVRDRMRQLAAWWHCFWAQRAIRKDAGVRRVIAFRQSVATGGATPVIPAGALPAKHADANLNGASPLATSDNHVHIPHVVEEADGRLYVEQWDVSLN